MNWYVLGVMLGACLGSGAIGLWLGSTVQHAVDHRTINSLYMRLAELQGTPVAGRHRPRPPAEAGIDPRAAVDEVVESTVRDLAAERAERLRQVGAAAAEAADQSLEFGPVRRRSVVGGAV